MLIEDLLSYRVLRDRIKRAKNTTVKEEKIEKKASQKSGPFFFSVLVD
jgi:hypothetical protein